MDKEKINREKLIRYFSEGCTPQEKKRTGLELEHFITEKNTGKSVAYSGKKGIEAVLKRISGFYPEKIYSEGHLVGLGDDNSLLSLEPAAQLEISIAPKYTIYEIEEEYNRFYRRIHPVLEEFGYDMVNWGYQPVSKISELERIPKKRYEYMEDYFRRKGNRGAYMMKGSAACHIAVDYASEEEFDFIYRTAYSLNPLFAFLTDNTPVFEGAPVKRRMLRQWIWEDVDRDRTKPMDGLFRRRIRFANYADFVLDTPIVVLPEPDGSTVYSKHTPRELYRDREMTEEELEHVLSMVFPDVRLKNYLEIRVGDSMPVAQSLAYAALIKGLFADLQALGKLMGQLRTGNWADVKQAYASLIKDGAEAQVYGIRVTELLEHLFSLALKNLGEEKRYLLPLWEKAGLAPVAAAVK